MKKKQMNVFFSVASCIPSVRKHSSVMAHTIASMTYTYTNGPDEGLGYNVVTDCVPQIDH